MAAPGCRGVSRVLEKLENSIKNGDYYEAHQMYRTLYFRWAFIWISTAGKKCRVPTLLFFFRYLGQKKYKDLKDMLYQGSILFLDADQVIREAIFIA